MYINKKKKGNFLGAVHIPQKEMINYNKKKIIIVVILIYWHP